ncbi:MAG: hypothetical protein WBP64_08845 [Nitrososphaeraceae archaeon]
MVDSSAPQVVYWSVQGLDLIDNTLTEFEEKEKNDINIKIDDVAYIVVLL